MKLYLLTLSISMLLTGSLHLNAGDAIAWKKPKEEPSLIRLHSSERVFSDSTFIKDAVLATANNRQSFYVLSSLRGFVVYDRENKRVRRISMPVKGLSGIATAIDSKDNIYVADSEANEVVVLNSYRQVQSRFSAPRPYSIAVLKNGNVVIASPSNNSLLHMFTPEGRWLKSFGELKSLNQNSIQQNNALNKGKVLVDSFDNIYYVSLFALDPYVLKFSPKGKRLTEFPITGEAVDLQREVGSRLLANISSDTTGGLLIITSASIDRETNHLWVSMNGSSETGLIYEYNQRGEKLKEYALVVNSRAIAGVKHILAKSPLIYAFTPDGEVYKFNVNNTSNSVAVLTAGPCPEDQGWGECKSNCNNSQSGDDKDCVEALKASVNHQGSAVVQYSCTRNSNECSLRVSLCNKTTENITNHETDLSCTPTPPPPEIICEQGELNSYDGIRCDSPIVIDTQGDGFDLTNASNGVNFDINADGVPERLAWTSMSSDDAWLALDRNGNRIIDNGQELFGNFTPQPASPAPNGFLALAEYDKPATGGNGDDSIDNRDAIFASLRLWLDLNHDGVSEPGELSTLPALGLTGLDLDYRERKRRDEHGN